MAGAGGSIGLLLGGVLTEWVSWRWVLLINVPVGLVMLALIPRHLAGSGRGSGRFDLAGALSGTLGTATLVYGFIRVGSGGWGDGQAGVAFALALLVLGGFVAVERRAEQPLLPFRLFAGREAASAYVTMLLSPPSCSARSSSWRSSSRCWRSPRSRRGSRSCLWVRSCSPARRRCRGGCRASGRGRS